MAALNKPGLWEALRDLGVDVPAGMLEFGDVVSPVVSLGDLTYNYRPTLRARLHAHAIIGPIALEYAGLCIQANQGGLWVMDLQILGGGNTQWWFTAPGSPWAGSAGGSNLAWTVTGSDPGQAVAGAVGITQGWIKNSLLNTSTSLPIGSSAQMVIFPTTAHQVRPWTPVWLPGNCWINIVTRAVNTQLVANVVVQAPAEFSGAQWS